MAVRGFIIRLRAMAIAAGPVDRTSRRAVTYLICGMFMNTRTSAAICAIWRACRKLFAVIHSVEAGDRPARRRNRAGLPAEAGLSAL